MTKQLQSLKNRIIIIVNLFCRCMQQKKKNTTAAEIEKCGVCQLDDTNDQEGDRWILCPKCMKWYQQKCLAITDDQFSAVENSASWICAKCNDLSSSYTKYVSVSQLINHFCVGFFCGKA